MRQTLRQTSSDCSYLVTTPPLRPTPPLVTPLSLTLPLLPPKGLLLPRAPRQPRGRADPVQHGHPLRLGAQPLDHLLPNPNPDPNPSPNHDPNPDPHQVHNNAITCSWLCGLRGASTSNSLAQMEEKLRLGVEKIQETTSPNP